MAKIKHGLAHTRGYQVWRNMVARCTNSKHPNFENYGGRGISVCDRWLDVHNFVADMGHPEKGMTLERRNNSMGYFPENCEWADYPRQLRNRRLSLRWVINGVEYESDSVAAHALGLGRSTVKAWCSGRTARGRYYAPKEGCFTKRVYEQEQR